GKKKMKENRSKAMALLVTLLMIGSVLVTLVPSMTTTATTVTKTDVPESIVSPGQKNVVVMMFTITEDGTDELIKGNATVGAALSDGADADWKMDSIDATDGDAWDPNNDTIFIDANDNDTYDSGETVVAGKTPAVGTSSTDGFDSDWNFKSYDATDGDAWDPSSDMIVYEEDNNSAYGDKLKGVVVKNNGTATDTDFSEINLYLESGYQPGFQADNDTLLDSFTWVPANEWWSCVLTTPITLWDESKTFYVVANISSSPTVRSTIQFFIPAGGVTLESTDGVSSNMVNANVITIGELGVNYFEGTQDGPEDVVYTDTKELVYGATVNLQIDTSNLTKNTEYYLYYPYYKRVGSGGIYDYYLEWRPYKVAGGASDACINTTGGGIKTFAEPIYFNVSGMWLLVPKGESPENASKGTATDYAYFWVNGTEAYQISLSTDKVYYGKNETITITVTEGGSAAGVWVDVRRESDGRLVFHKWAGDGTVTFNSDWLNNLTYAGNYTVFAYKDIDPTIIGYGTYGYSEDYGYSDPTISTENYSAICGPWDPPEKVSKVAKIVVETGKPQLEIPETNRTMYWNFSGEVKVYIKGYDGKNLTSNLFTVKVYNSEKEDVTSYLTIDKSQPGIIKISCDNWGWDSVDGTWGINGTWKIVVSYDKDSDGTEEWNNSVSFTVTKAPGVQIIVTYPENKEISEVPDISSQPITIKFQVVNREHHYLGEGNLSEDKKNITLSGDILFVGEGGKTLSEYEEIFPGSVNVTHNIVDGTWTWEVDIIPLMDTNGGEITISVDWGDWGTDEETIQVGGANLNGSIVTITPSEFVIGENITLTVKVADATGYAYPNAHVALYYFDDTTGTILTTTSINETDGGGTTSGEYSFLFNVTQQTNWQKDKYGLSEVKAPRYIIAYADIPNVGPGYAYAIMKPKADLKVEVSRDTFMAGKAYNFWINVSTIDLLTGNETGTPSDSGLHVRIYNETGADVTNTIGSLTTSELDGSASIELSSEYFTEPGTYYIYAYNDTHNSEGYNATIEVVPVEVTCDKSEFIWGV
ncbi:MAG: hypothetical protein DRN78_05120, partial [Thermoproteota archaeon]